MKEFNAFRTICRIFTEYLKKSTAEEGPTEMRMTRHRSTIVRLLPSVMALCAASSAAFANPSPRPLPSPLPKTGSNEPTDPSKPYKRKQISNARFGERERQVLLKKAYRLQGEIEKSVVGQERIGKAMQDRLVQYLENLGTRTKDPIALHMIGLPGIGKSATLDVLERSGIQVIRIDAQQFIGQNAGSAMSNLKNNLYSVAQQQKATNMPLILLFDEIDKVAEIVKNAGHLEEKSNELVGFLNQLLTDGKVPYQGGASAVLDFSNTMVITAMNFSPDEIEKFSEEALGKTKSFYDFTVDDFSKFDEWMRKEPAARSKVLSRLFRSNTVSRLAPNTLIVKPLDQADYRKIAKINIESAINSTTTGVAANKKITVTYTDRYLDFIAANTVYPPSGARETVMKSNALTEQVISFGTKLRGGDDTSLTQPRSIVLDYDPVSGKTRIEVTPVYRRATKQVLGQPFETLVEFDLDSKSYRQPPDLAIEAPLLKQSPSSAKVKPLSKKEILAARFPKQQNNELKGLAEKIDQKLIGQKYYTTLIEKDLTTFVNRPGPVKKNPPFRVIAGFPGIGKSELANLAGEHAGLPIARINMQAYSASDSGTLFNFLSNLQDEISKAKSMSKNGKFILLFEELDKVFEINPQSGAFVDRPVMNYIKDLLNDGHIAATMELGGGGRRTFNIDARDAYNMVTMNFGVDKFGFTADPRLTSVDDVLGAWKRLQRPADLKKILGSLFLPETVSRMMSRFIVMKPLDVKDYEKIIDLQVESVIRSRLYDPLTGQNKGQIEINLSPEYKRYLYSESVIPSEGARHTVLTSQQRLSRDLEDALSNIPKSSVFGTKPLIIELGFKPESTTVVATASLKENPEQIAPKLILNRQVELTFPPLHTKGQMPSGRLLTAVHEFGHGYAGVRLGRRFDFATVVPPQSGVGGYVRFKGGTGKAQEMVSDIYASLASRSMERIFLSDDPLKAASVLDITSGASNDILQATEKLWNLKYELGFDPGGGTIERRGVNSAGRYASFADIPADEVKKLGVVLRQMEDYMVEDFLKAHPKEWYIDKIGQFAQAGGMTEHEFFNLIEYAHPGDNSINIAQRDPLQQAFKGKIIEEPAEIAAARNFKQGLTKTTAAENLDAATAFFDDRLQHELNGRPGKPASGSGSCVRDGVGKLNDAIK